MDGRGSGLGFGLVGGEVVVVEIGVGIVEAGFVGFEVGQRDLLLRMEQC